MHEGQQMHLEQDRPEIVTARFQMQQLVLRDSILAPELQAAAAVRLRQHHARHILALALRRRQPASAWRLFRDSGLGVAQLLLGLGSYR